MRILCIDNPKDNYYSIERQCSGEKLKLTRTDYKLFLMLISKEIIYSERARYEILENKTSFIVDLYTWTQYPDNTIEKILLEV